MLLPQPLRNEDDYEKFASDNSRAHVTVGSRQQAVLFCVARAAVFAPRTLINRSSLQQLLSTRLICKRNRLLLLQQVLRHSL